LNINRLLFLVFAIITLAVFAPYQKGVAQSQGPLNSGTQVNNTSGGTKAWINPSFSGASDNIYTIAVKPRFNYMIINAIMRDSSRICEKEFFFPFLT